MKQASIRQNVQSNMRKNVDSTIRNASEDRLDTLERQSEAEVPIDENIENLV